MSNYGKVEPAMFIADVYDADVHVRWGIFCADGPYYGPRPDWLDPPPPEARHEEK